MGAAVVVVVVVVDVAQSRRVAVVDPPVRSSVLSQFLVDFNLESLYKSGISNPGRALELAGLSMGVAFGLLQPSLSNTFERGRERSVGGRCPRLREAAVQSSPSPPPRPEIVILSINPGENRNVRGNTLK